MPILPHLRPLQGLVLGHFWAYVEMRHLSFLCGEERCKKLATVVPADGCADGL